jgi:phosphoserine aminotransferase
MGLCQAAGISGLKGHRSVGGYRASMYNAPTIDSVEIWWTACKRLKKNIKKK